VHGTSRGPVQPSTPLDRALIPDAILKDPSLSAGARLFLVLVAEYQGKRLECFPPGTTLAGWLISHPSSAAFLAPGMFAALAHRAFRMRVLDAHLLAHLRRPIEEVFQVCYAGVRRLSLHEVIIGFAHDGTAVDAALDLCRQQARSVAENFGGEGLRGRERFRNWVALALRSASSVFVVWNISRNDRVGADQRSRRPFCID